MRLILLGSVLSIAAWAGQPQRIAVVVGANSGLVDEAPLRYAEADAAKMAKALTDLGEFEKAATHVLLAKNAQGVREFLHRLSGASPSFVFFYYSGHGGPNGLHLSGTTLAFSELNSLLGKLGARVTVAVLDSCSSGAMTRVKGARPGPAYDIDVLRDPDVEGRIVIASSSDDEVSQESERLQGSFFTYFWVSGLYGAADANDDQLVSLEEAFRFAHFRTIERTIETKVGVQRPSFAFALAGQGNLVLANLSRSTAQLDVETAKSGNGHYFVFDAEKQLLLTEMTRSRQGRASIRVPPGKYRVRKREADGSRVLDVTLRAGESVRVSDADMTEMPFDEQSKKGESGVVLHQPHMNVGVRSGLSAGMSAGLQLSAAYRIGFRIPYVQLFGQFAIARSVNVAGITSRHFEGTIGLGIGLHRLVGRFRFAAGPDVGLVLFREMVEAPGSAPLAEGLIPIGLQVGLSGQVSSQLTEKLSVTVDVQPALILYKEAGEQRTGFAVRAAVGMLYTFQ